MKIFDVLAMKKITDSKNKDEAKMVFL